MWFSHFFLAFFHVFPYFFPSPLDQSIFPQVVFFPSRRRVRHCNARHRHANEFATPGAIRMRQSGLFPDPELSFWEKSHNYWVRKWKLEFEFHQQFEYNHCFSPMLSSFGSKRLQKIWQQKTVMYPGPPNPPAASQPPRPSQHPSENSSLVRPPNVDHNVSDSRSKPLNSRKISQKGHQQKKIMCSSLSESKLGTASNQSSTRRGRKDMDAMSVTTFVASSKLQCVQKAECCGWWPSDYGNGDPMAPPHVFQMFLKKLLPKLGLRQSLFRMKSNKDVQFSYTLFLRVCILYLYLQLFTDIYKYSTVYKFI